MTRYISCFHNCKTKLNFYVEYNSGLFVAVQHKINLVKFSPHSMIKKCVIFMTKENIVMNNIKIIKMSAMKKVIVI
jgi:hypothetical protein